MLLSITTDLLKKALFSHDKNKQRVYNICCSGKKNGLAVKKEKTHKQKQKQNKTKQKWKTKLKQKNEKKWEKNVNCNLFTHEALRVS